MMPLSSNARCLDQEPLRISRMMKHIDERHHVYALVRARDQPAIKFADLNVRGFPNEYIDTFNCDIVTRFGTKLCNLSISCSHIENLGVSRQQAANQLRKHVRSSIGNQFRYE